MIRLKKRFKKKEEDEEKEDDDYSEENIAERKQLRRELLPRIKKPYYPPYN